MGPSLSIGSILARMSPNLQGELAQISHEPSRAEKPPARAESELNRAELTSDASLIGIMLKLYFFKILTFKANIFE